MKTMMGYHFTPVGMTEIKKKKNDNTKWGEGLEQVELSHCWWQCKMAFGSFL